MKAMSTTTLYLLCLCVYLLVIGKSLSTDTLKCGVKLKLEVLPGRGWDNLRNKDMGQVLEFNYEQCRTTEDGVYLIPDHVSTIPVKESNMDLSAELIEHYSSYSSITARSFKAEATASYYSASRAASVSGSFSTGYQDAKMKQVGDQSVTTRIQVRNTLYSVVAEPTADVHPSLKQLMAEAGREVEKNNIGKAQVMMELIIRDYGTHYLTFVDAGAVLVQEDFVASSFVQQQQANKNRLGVAASASFLGKFGLGVSYEQSSDKTMIDGYKQSITSSSVRSIGGASVEPNMTVHQWLDNTKNNLVAIDRSGEPLNYIVTPQRFPDINMNTLGKLRDLMEGAIDDYYSWNTHAGCMTVGDNFDINANFDDRSCKKTFNSSTFGGVFQTCKVITKDAPNSVCDYLSQPNIITTGFTCPEGYDVVPLHTAQATLPYGVKDCSDICIMKFWIFEVCIPPEKCKDKTQYATVEYSTSWCHSVKPQAANTGLMFGGLFTAMTQNPLTKSLGCPSTFVPRLAGFHLNVCIGNDYELGAPYSVPFGGFFSCSNGNPLVTLLNPKSNVNAYRNPGDPYPHGCPSGYSQHMAAVDHDCMINYCVKADSFRGLGMLPVVRPPFRDPANLFMNMSMLSAPAAHNPEPSLSTGALAGIIVGGLVGLIVIIVILTVAFRRCRRNRSRPDDHERQPTISDSQHYGTINDAEKF